MGSFEVTAVRETHPIQVKLRVFRRRLRAFLGKGFVHEKQIIVDPVNSQWDDVNPIFLIGVHRSGTSLLRRIVDSHPDIAVPPESYFISHFCSLISDENTFHGLYGMGFDEGRARVCIANLASFFHRTYAKSKGKPRWADKTPAYALILDDIDKLFLQKSQFVFIFRHPLDVAYSNWSRGWHHRHYTGDLLIDTCRYVEESDQRQLAFIERNGHRTYALFYEALVKDPRPQLEGLCAFLGADWHEALLSWWHTQHDFGTEDPIVRGTRGFEPSLGNYRAWDQEQRLAAREILDDVIFRLGYTEHDGIPVHTGSFPHHQRARGDVTAQSTVGN
jgi:hypothetical protein